MSLHGRWAPNSGAPNNSDATQPLPRTAPPPRPPRQPWRPPSPIRPARTFRSAGPAGYGSQPWQPSGGGGWWQPRGTGAQRADRDRLGVIAVTAVAVAVLLAIGIGIGMLTGYTTGRSGPSQDARGGPKQAPGGPGSQATPSARTSATTSPAPSVPTPESASTISSQVSPGVVDVDSQLAAGGTAAGTGMVVSSTGEILTNNHVIDGATSIRVVLVTSGRSYPATVVGTDATDDVAVLQIRARGLATIPLGNSSGVGVGDLVVALGNAGGVNGLPSVASGSIEALNQSITASDPGADVSENLSGLLQTDAALQPGDSGGPLINVHGQVIGMDTAASTHVRAGGVAGFAIPINTAVALAAKIESGEINSSGPSDGPGFLGVDVEPISQAVRSEPRGYAPPVASGAWVYEVVPGGPAQSSGLVAGDIIVSLGGQLINSPSDLTAALQDDRVGAVVQVGLVSSSGRPFFVHLLLVAPPPN